MKQMPATDVFSREESPSRLAGLSDKETKMKRKKTLFIVSCLCLLLQGIAAFAQVRPAIFLLKKTAGNLQEKTVVIKIGGGNEYWNEQLKKTSASASSSAAWLIVENNHSNEGSRSLNHVIDARITNSYGAEKKDNGHHHCLFAEYPDYGRRPVGGEAKIGHYVASGQKGNCMWTHSYYFRSRIYFDIDDLKGKKITRALLQLRMADSLDVQPDFPTNEELSSRCDIYLLNGPWQAVQPAHDFYPGSLVKSFSLFSKGEMGNVDLLDVVRGWVAGRPNHGLMLRGPLNRSKFEKSVNLRYYGSIRLEVSYLD